MAKARFRRVESTPPRRERFRLELDNGDFLSLWAPRRGALCQWTAFWCMAHGAVLLSTVKPGNVPISDRAAKAWARQWLKEVRS